jgi:hypothetical protein
MTRNIPKMKHHQNSVNNRHFGAALWIPTLDQRKTRYNEYMSQDAEGRVFTEETPFIR